MRESIGTDVDLMCDINPLWSVHHASTWPAHRGLPLYWLEDHRPRRLRPASPASPTRSTPDRAGEYTTMSVPHLLERARSTCDDRLLGLAHHQWMNGGMAEAFNLRVSHLIPESTAPDAASHGLTVEVQRGRCALEETPKIEMAAVVPTSPAWAWRSLRPAIKRFQVG